MRSAPGKCGRERVGRSEAARKREGARTEEKCRGKMPGRECRCRKIGCGDRLRFGIKCVSLSSYRSETMQGMKILILNGPNLNLQGRRDVAVYGTETFEHWRRLPARGLSRRCDRLCPVEHRGRTDRRHTAGGGSTTASCSMPEATPTPRCRSAMRSRPCPFRWWRCTFRRSSPARSFAASRSSPPWPWGSVMGFGLLSYELGLLALLRRADEAAGIRASDLQ